LGHYWFITKETNNKIKINSFGLAMPVDQGLNGTHFWKLVSGSALLTRTALKRAHKKE